MSDSEAFQRLEDKYKELLRAFKSVVQKVNENEERYCERFAKVEKSVETLEVKVQKADKEHIDKINELHEKKKKVESDLKSVEEKLLQLNEELENQTKRLGGNKEAVINKDSEVSTFQNCKTSPARKLFCKQCNSQFDSMQILTRHIKKDHQDMKNCPFCDVDFKVSLDLEMHISEHHKTEVLSCDNCDAKFYTKWRLRKHKRIHENIRIRNCHYFNSDKFCPFAKIGCKFKHEYSQQCIYGEKCVMDRCQYRHMKNQQ